jgi:predicted heme/steroid binding protein
MFKTLFCPSQSVKGDHILVEEIRTFTSEELEEYNGKNGKPAYIAYQGKIYDVSQSDLWRSGEHMGLHGTGKDLTDELELAPHGEEVLERTKLKLVGKLV